MYLHLAAASSSRVRDVGSPAEITAAVPCSTQLCTCRITHLKTPPSEWQMGLTFRYESAHSCPQDVRYSINVSHTTKRLVCFMVNVRTSTTLSLQASKLHVLLSQTVSLSLSAGCNRSQTLSASMMKGISIQHDVAVLSCLQRGCNALQSCPATTKHRQTKRALPALRRAQPYACLGA